MLREELEQVKAIAREIAKEEIMLFKKSLKASEPILVTLAADDDQTDKKKQGGKK